MDDLPTEKENVPGIRQKARISGTFFAGSYSSNPRSTGQWSLP